MGREISGQWKSLPVVLALTFERDGEIRKIRFKYFAIAYKSLGDEIWRYVWKLTDAQKSMLDDRFKWKAKLKRRRQELTQTTSNQPVDDEAVYYKVAGECPKGRVYGLGSLGRKKRRYADADASTSQVLAQRGMEGMGNFMILRLATEFISFVANPSLMSNGLATEFINSVANPLLIRDGLATECK
ncbi:hypothetical protein Scep_004869 [Stephania cephalantha]|uniref:Uncharacterized protein n=1 Tax=Stephania cephalantha TaxID=152367 RepID=A0AAP0KVR9_9MAGN